MVMEVAVKGGKSDPEVRKRGEERGKITLHSHNSTLTVMFAGRGRKSHVICHMFADLFVMWRQCRRGNVSVVANLKRALQIQRLK